MIKARTNMETAENGQELVLSPVLFEMMRSFTTLARTQNLSMTVDLLGVSRQTIRRHVAHLEDLLECRLLVLEPSGYCLTPEGQHHFKRAEKLLDNARMWFSGCSTADAELDCIVFNDKRGRYYYAQQYPLIDVWNKGVPAIKQTFDAWCRSRGNLDSSAYDEIKGNVLVYRPHHASWLCVHVGEQSALATWLGPVWAKSVIGAVLENDPVANPSDLHVMNAYREVLETGSARFDHVAAKLSRGPDAPLEAVNYQRLLMASRFPDGAPALIVFTWRTNAINLGKLKHCKYDKTLPDLVMDAE